VAVLLARRLGGRLDVLGVCVPPPVLDYGFGALVVPPVEQSDAIRARLGSDIRAQLHRCDSDDISPALSTGAAPWLIADEAWRHHADVIVIGLGAHGILERALGGETALDLAQLAITPVLAVPSAADSLPHHVIAGVDFSPTSVQAAMTAARWLTAGDTISLVHVSGAHPDASRADELRSVTTERLADLASRIEVQPGVRTEIREVHGETAHSLLHVAERSQADLIAIGSHGYGFWKRLAIGSVASKLLRLSTRSVLVVPIGCVALPHPAASPASRAGVAA
jgi:nucleotide-binding universal stress UspA family protein